MLDVFTAAGAMAFGPCSAVGSIVGFTSIVQTLPEFQAMLDGVFNFNMPAALILIIAVCLIAALTSSSTAAIRVAVPMVAERCTAAGLSLAFIHRVSCFACSIVDTLPYGTAVIINLGIADLDMKEGYPHVHRYYTGDRLRHHHLRTLYVSVPCSAMIVCFSKHGKFC